LGRPYPFSERTDKHWLGGIRVELFQVGSGWIFSDFCELFALFLFVHFSKLESKLIKFKSITNKNCKA
jgi:hypothetical protein